MAKAIREYCDKNAKFFKSKKGSGSVGKDKGGDGEKEKNNKKRKKGGEGGGDVEGMNDDGDDD